MDTNKIAAKQHTVWVNKEQNLRPSVEAVLPLLKKQDLRCMKDLARGLNILFEHLGEYGQAKKDLTAIKRAKTHGYNFKGTAPTDADVKKQAALSKTKQSKLDNILASITGHYQEAMSFPHPLGEELDNAMKAVQDYLRCMAKKFESARGLSHKEMAKRGASKRAGNKVSFNDLLESL